MRRAGRSRRTRVEASRIAWPELRRSAPSEAPVRKSTPVSASSTPRIVEPVVPIPRETSASSCRPMKPPCEEPSASITPTSAMLTPILNGPTSTSELRVISSTPIGSSATGSRYAAQPSSERAALVTGPPFRPNQRTHEKKIPIAISPRPSSSTSWLRFRARFRLRLVTRAGVFGRGLAVRVLRRACAIGWHFAPGVRPPSYESPQPSDAMRSVRSFTNAGLSIPSPTVAFGSRASRRPRQSTFVRPLPCSQPQSTSM